MKSTNGYIYFTKGLYVFENVFCQWVSDSKNENDFLETHKSKQAAIDYVISEHNAQFLDYEELSPEKLEILKGFYARMYCHHHKGGKIDFSDEEEILCALHIPYFVQNAVSELAEKKPSIDKYLKPQIETIWNDWLNWLNQKAA